MIEDMKVIVDNTMSQLLNLYQSKDWGVSWIKFIETFTEIVYCLPLEIGKWQIDFEEEEE